jgi:hypothetical protein
MSYVGRQSSLLFLSLFWFLAVGLSPALFSLSLGDVHNSAIFPDPAMSSRGPRQFDRPFRRPAKRLESISHHFVPIRGCFCFHVFSPYHQAIHLPHPWWCFAGRRPDGDIRLLVQWKHPDLNQQGTMCYPFRLIDVENINGGPTHGCFANQGRSAPSEMLGPLVMPWIEERQQSACHRIVSGRVWSFVQVACRAGQADIAKGARTVMFLGANMIKLVRQRCACLWQLAVFATSPSSRPYQPALGFSHLAFMGREIQR